MAIMMGVRSWNALGKEVGAQDQELQITADEEKIKKKEEALMANRARGIRAISNLGSIAGPSPVWGAPGHREPVQSWGGTGRATAPSSRIGIIQVTGPRNPNWPTSVKPRSIVPGYGATLF